MNYRTGKRKGIFMSWLLSYILILLIPLMINIYAYIQSVNIIETEINKNHAASLKQVQQLIDNRLKDIEKLSVEIAFNNKIQGLVGYKKELTPYQINTTIDIIKDIKVYKIANSFIDDIYIFFKHNNFILGQNGKYTPAEFYKYYCTNYGQDYEEWFRMLNHNHVGKYITTGENNDKLSKKIIYTRSLPIEYLGESNAVNVMVIDEYTLINAIRDVNWVHHGIIIVADQNHSIIMSTIKEFDISSITHNHKLDNSKGLFHQKIKGQEYIISYITSSATGWIYISILPTRIFLDKAKYIKKVIFISAIICLIAGVWIAYVFSKKNYNPVKRVIDILVDSIGKISGNAKNEYYLIEQSILQVIAEKDKLNEQIHKQTDVLRNNFLERLIKGELKSYISIQDACEKYDIYFDYDNFAVMLFYIDDVSSRFIFEQSDEDADRTFEKAQFVIINVVEELINESNKGYMVNTGDLLVCISNFMDREKAKDSIHYVLDKAITFVDDKFSIRFSAAVSDIHTSYEGIHIAYQEAIEAFEFNIILRNKQIIYYSDITGPCEKYHGSSFSEHQKFINAIKVGNYKEAEEIFSVMIEKDFEKAVPSTQMLKCKMFGLLNTMIMAVEEASIVCGTELWEDLKPVERLLKCNTVECLSRELNSILRIMDEYVESNRNKQNDVLINDIILFVNKAYTDINLSVSMIADKFNINPSYLSRLFKIQKGICLLDFIHKTRIGNAKKLINNTDMSLKDIGNQVGYYNNIGFIRAFKRYEGITPGQYKTINGS